MPFNLYITRTITDKNGKIVKKYRKRLAKSFVKAWLEYLSGAWGHAYSEDADNVSITDTSGTPQTMTWGTSQMQLAMCMESPSANVNYGILIGTGTTPPATADYALETKIVEGSGAGQMNHAPTAVLTASVAGAKMELQITRVIVNNSGGAITVKEVGIAVQHAGFYFLLVHDAVDDAVADGQTYTLTYTVETTV